MQRGRPAEPITYNGRTLTRQQWAEALGYPYSTMVRRLNTLPLAEALRDEPDRPCRCCRHATCPLQQAKV